MPFRVSTTYNIIRYWYNVKHILFVFLEKYVNAKRTLEPFFLIPPCLYSIVSSYDCTWCEFFVPCVLFTSMTISFEQYEEYVNDACCSLKIIIIQQDFFTLILAICNNSKISTTIKQFSLVSLEICSFKTYSFPGVSILQLPMFWSIKSKFTCIYCY